MLACLVACSNEGAEASDGSTDGGSTDANRSEANHPTDGNAPPEEPAPECAADAGNDECAVCLGGACCTDLTQCLADPTCGAAFSRYRVCIRGPGVDPSGCYSEFGRAVLGGGGDGDGGTPDASAAPRATPGANVPLCILSSCAVCGTPQLF
jgi:hypothetical protein